MSVNGNKRSVYFGIIWWAWRLLGAVELNARNLGSYRFWRAVALNAIVTAAFPVMLILTTLSFELPLDNLMNFNISLTSVATSVKFLIYVKQLRKIPEIERLLTKLDTRVTTNEQRAEHATTSRMLSIISKLYTLSYVAIGINSNVSVFFREQRSLPFPAWFPLDWTNSLTNYFIALMHQFLAIFMQILQNFVDDLFPPLVLILIAGHCDQLVLRLSAIGYDQSDRRSNEQKLIKCIRDHQMICRLHLLAMEIISWPLLVQFIVISIDVGAALCALLFYVESMQERLYYASFIFALALQIFPVCYYGTLVEYSFGRLHYAAYSSNWVDQSITYRKNLIIFAERTQKLPNQRAGNFIPIALTTFLANCKAAYSFCTLIADNGTDK
ncbi:odorant receptor 23a [Drosophila novamexicana]|uniref:odorant receptor 23a n=1 Tax=Drosophila novamexicana TaxID=47314 RepID=UPI0011E5ECD1|nr:odorant receptor 23a [Drosophila novamexicana]